MPPVAAALAALLVGACGGGDDASPGAKTAARPAARPPALCGELRTRIVGRVGAPAATELSGLVLSRSQPGVLWTHDDSGGRAHVLAVGSDGGLLADVTLTGAENADWEDIAIGDAQAGARTRRGVSAATTGDALLVADIGDNPGQRASVAVYRADEPRVRAGAATAMAPVPATRIVLRYPDGPRDAEALLVDPSDGTLVIVEKSFTGRAGVYVGGRPAADAHPTMLRRSGRLSLGGGEAVTAGDVSGDGRTIVLRTYARAFVWARRAGERVGAALRRRPCVARAALHVEGQGEALALSRAGCVLHRARGSTAGDPALRAGRMTRRVFTPREVGNHLRRTRRELGSAHIPRLPLLSAQRPVSPDRARFVNGGAKERGRPRRNRVSPMKRSATTTTPESLSTYIQARFDDFSRSQKDVAQYIVDHLDEVAFQTAEELARRANTSSSTVVRFSQALGFEGYPELQHSAREEYRRRHAPSPLPPHGAGAAAPLFSLDQNEFETMLAADHVNVEDTARKASRSEIEAAVEAIATTPRLLVAGTDQMAFFASYLRHLLMLLDLRAEIVASPSQEALGRLSRIDEETLVIGLSAGRPHPLVVRAMKLARHRKARTMAITDATLSEVAKLAQIRLYYSSNSPAYVRSHTALLSMVQALAYGVYARDADGYADRIKAFKLK